MRRFPPIALAFAFLSAGSTLQADPTPGPVPSAIISRIKRLPVESSALATIGYGKKLRALEIEFRNGAIYRYLEVDPAVYRELMSADSKARYYDAHIRRKFRSVRVKSRSG